jgi:hypothetical protein
MFCYFLEQRDTFNGIALAVYMFCYFLEQRETFNGIALEV